MEWWQYLTAGGAVSAFFVAVGTYLRTRPAMKLAQIKGEEALWARIANLEAQVADLSHNLANETMSFDSFLLLAETNPEKVGELIPRIREERQRHRERMALKRGVREGTAIAAATERDAV